MIRWTHAPLGSAQAVCAAALGVALGCGPAPETNAPPIASASGADTESGTNPGSGPFDPPSDPCDPDDVGDSTGGDALDETGSDFKFDVGAPDGPIGFGLSCDDVQGAPSNQIIVGLSLFLTFFIMGPTIDRIHTEALKPYLDGRMQSQEALDKATGPLREFMLKQTRTRNLEYFLELGGYGPTPVKDLPMRVVIPSFVLSELQAAFQMGFLLFLPFLVIDFLVSSVLMSLGMMMMPPNVVSLPFKLLLFVLVDGWHLIVQSLVQSFS